MPSDNREQSFENALAAHLRAGAKSIPHTECSDAETLAAYHEGSLAAEQVASLKTHIASCDRCQQLLTTLEATDQIPAPSVNVILQPAAAKSAVHVLPARKRALWQWVAPAGALAAALLVWVAVHENTSSIIPVKAPSPSAKRDARQAETAKPLPSASQPEAPPSDDSKRMDNASSDSLRALHAAPRSIIPRLPRERAERLSKQKDSPSAAKNFAVPLDLDQFADNSLNHSDLSQNELPAPKLEAQNQIVIIEPDKTETREKIVNGRRDAPPPKPPQPAPERSAGTSPAPSAPSPGSAQSQVYSESAGIVTQQQEMGGMSRFKQNEVRLAHSVAEVTIPAPGGQISWRVGQAGIIQFSPDAGKSWIMQPSGVISDLLAGSAPSDRVCWIVGRGGTLLRTTDGGEHWQKIRPPSQEDLHFVLAVDARQATVSSANAKYQTTDGGITWKKLPPE
jgi:Photosynthesis system II assembly factor YCF48